MTVGTPMTSERSTLATWPAAKRLTLATWPAAKRLTDCEGLSDHPTYWRTAFTANFFQKPLFLHPLHPFFFLTPLCKPSNTAFYWRRSSTQQCPLAKSSCFATKFSVNFLHGG